VRHPGSIALAPAGIVAAVLYYFITSGNWQEFGIWPEPSIIGWTTGFADLANQTATADCIRNGTDLTTCDPYGRPFQPYAVIPASLLAALGLGVAQTGVLGVALAAIYVFTIWFLGRSIARNWLRHPVGLAAALAALTLAAISPPALLLVERGQIEILVLLFAALGLAAFARPSPLIRGMGAISLTVSVVVKYFNVGVFAAFLAPRRWSWWAGAAMAASFAFLVINFTDVIQARETARADLASTSRVMFGSTTMFVTLAEDDPLAFFAQETQPMVIYRLAGLAVLAAFAALWWWSIRRIDIASMPNLAWFWLVGSIGSVGAPYLLGDSNDYRLALLLPALAGAAIWLGTRGHVLPLTILISLIVIAMVTNAWMIPNEAGWLMPEWAMVGGEVAISATVGFGLALLARSWTNGGNQSESLPRH